MQKYLLALLLVGIFSSCSTTSKIQVTRVGDEPENVKQKVVYALPQTLLNLTITFEKETFVPGPYRLYTERYLGMKDYISEPGYSYRILSVDLNTFTEPDPDQFYSLNVLEGSLAWNEYLSLSSHGLVLDPSATVNKLLSKDQADVYTGSPYFTDLSVKRNMVEVTDTLYKTLIRDSSYVRVPVLRKQREAKTLEQKAEEAANFIIKIRKRRFKLLAGQYELFPEGDALALSVEELDKLEKEYLELFIGKRVKQVFRKSYLISPEKKTEAQKFIPFYFSQVNGLTASPTPTAKPVSLEIIPQNKLSLIRKNSKSQGFMPNNLYYRIPDIAEVRIGIENELLYEGRISVYQLGELMNLPVGGQGAK